MDFQLPELGEGIYEAEIVDWLVGSGEAVTRGQAIAEVMTDKATIELPAAFDGIITEFTADPGDIVKVGQTLLRYQSNGHTSASKPPATSAAAAEAKPSSAARQPRKPALSTSPDESVHSSRQPVLNRAPAAPAVRRLARSLDIDLKSIRGTGPGGRILIEDLTESLQQKPAGGNKKLEAAKPDFEYGQPGTRIPFRGLRRKIAERMVDSAQNIPHYAYVDECDVTELVRLRETLRTPFSDKGVHLTYLSFFVRAVVGALREIPIVNASLDEERGEIALHGEYHIGIATATPKGLIVPVLRHADRMDLAQTAREIERIGRDARAGQIQPEDLGGGTFTITSIGGIGGLIATPIINAPEVGIMAIGKIVKRPVYDAAGNIRPADLVYLSFSFDHRIVDGAVGAVFGNAVIGRIQSAARLLLPDNL